MAHGSSKRRLDVRLLLLTCTAMAIPLFSHVIGARIPRVKELELQAYDRHMVNMPRLRPDPRLVLVGMDDGSRDSLFRQGLIDRPAYTRSMQARLLRELYSAGA